MAGRPVIKRTVETFTRDIESIKRLRASILLYENGPTSLDAIHACNLLIADLIARRNATETSQKAA